ncbi:MAG TPA: EAL domain-containing protein [Rubrobacteraceae bacterium]|nr:EAL domain-containing protein [Rubrobacteraceae bacterium]
MNPTESDPNNASDAASHGAHKDGYDEPALEEVLSKGVEERVRFQARTEEVHGSEEFFRLLVEGVKDYAIFMLNPGGRISSWNVGAERMKGYRTGEILGRHFSVFYSPKDIERGHPDEELRLARERGHFEEEGWRVRKDGSHFWASVLITALLDEEGKLRGFAKVVRDITERKDAEERLKHQALHDALTDLPNRHLLVDRLHQALRRTSRRQKNRVAVLFMDLDRFKLINDSLGHEAGDRVLVEVARRCASCLRTEDTLARFGGDEFVVLLEEVEGVHDALKVTQRITEEIRKPFALDGTELVLRLSIGVALGEAGTESPEKLLRDADIAMYRAKEEGSGYSVFDRAMHEQAQGRLQVENDLRHALENDEFTVYYQPRFRLGQPDSIEGVEALVRWEHPQRGFMLPGKFSQIAEETRLIIPIGGWVMKEACRQTKEWQERHPSEPPLAMCVKLSAGQVRNPGLLQEVRSALRESGLAPGNLILEITEGTLLKDTQEIETVFKELKALGVRLEIDDFGKEYSSLSYLNRLPVDGLKIDRLFLESFGENPSNMLIVKAVISLAHSLGLEVTGEGVQSAEQLELLRGMGCDFVQGYHLARPLPKEEVEQLLADHSIELRQDRRATGE